MCSEDLEGFVGQEGSRLVVGGCAQIEQVLISIRHVNSITNGVPEPLLNIARIVLC